MSCDVQSPAVGRDSRVDAPSQTVVLVRRGRVSTRQDLVDATGLSRSTVSQRIDALLEARLLVADNIGTSTGGRKPQILRFNPGSGIVLAVDLGASAPRAALLDLAGRVVAETDRGRSVADDTSAALDRVGQEAAILARQLPADAILHAVGVAAPETVHLPVATRLREQLGISVLVDQRGDLMALGEQRRCWPNIEDLIHVDVGATIAAGVVSGGRILRGSQGAGAEIGHVQVHPRDRTGTRCRCGNDGCLNAVAGGDALAGALSASGTPAASLTDVVRLLSEGNSAATPSSGTPAAFSERSWPPSPACSIPA